VDVGGNVYIADYGNDRVVKVPSDGGAETTLGTGLRSPAGVALDAAGGVYIADSARHRVVRVPSGGGAQTTVGTGLTRPTGLVVFAPAPMFTAETPPSAATVGSAYSYAYGADTPSGEPPARFGLGEGTLPPGLTLDPVTGVLSGKPTTAGRYSFRIMTSNAVNATIGPPTTITVKGPQQITFTSTPPNPAVIGGTYQVTATGGGSGNPVLFSVNANSTEGACEVELTGLVTFTGRGTCIINAFQAGDATHDPGSARQTITVVTAPPPPTNPPPPPTASPADITGSGSGLLAMTGTYAFGLVSLAIALSVAGLALLLVATHRRERRQH
jgi:hypothetical protein